MFIEKSSLEVIIESLGCAGWKIHESENSQEEAIRNNIHNQN